MALLPLNINIRLTISVLLMQANILLKYSSDLRIILVATLFYASACLGHFLAFENTPTLPAWPPSGIAFALIILMGRSAWPGIMIGSLLANVMAHWNNASLPAHAIIALSCMTAAASTIEALTGNFLVKQWIKNDYPFKNARNAFQFLLATLLMCVAGAVLGTLGLWLSNVVNTHELLKTALSWWVGNVVGILLFTPLVLSINYFRRFRLTSEKALEVGVFLLFAVALLLLFRFNTLNPTMEHALPFLILPFLLWLAFRFELMIAMAGVLQVSLLSIYITIQGAGPFVLDKPYYSMMLLQIYVGVTSISTIVLSATVKERMEAQRALLQFNETLEAKVQERTRALNEEINTRRQAEEKLQGTNYELSKRNVELDNFVYSVSHDLRAPVATVLGLINLAKKDNDIEMKDLYLSMIENSAKQQDHFIREILDQSRNSRLEVKREEVFFEPIIAETFDQLKHATAISQPVEKIINVRQEKPFYCDRWRLKVILNNIISNSIRYRNGKDPVIRVNVEVDSRGAKVEIEDNGKGIGKEHLGNVCKMFYRATDDGAGSGLGLYIVKETVDKLNGSINILSEVGKGTMVKLNIPEVLN